jgi:hypothetical protein
MRSMNMLAVGLVVMWVGAWSCAPPEQSLEGDEALQLSVEPAEVRAGDEVVLTLTNRSGDPVGYNLCVAVLDQRAADEWVERPERPTEFCTMELRVLPPEESATYRHTVPAELPPGEYRFRTGVESPLGEGRVEVGSSPFRIGE